MLSIQWRSRKNCRIAQKRRKQCLLRNKSSAGCVKKKRANNVFPQTCGDLEDFAELRENSINKVCCEPHAVRGVKTGTRKQRALFSSEQRLRKYCRIKEDGTAEDALDFAKRVRLNSNALRPVRLNSKRHKLPKRALKTAAYLFARIASSNMNPWRLAIF